MPSPFAEDESTCSLAQAFDELLMSLRQQALHYYRYGKARECADKWDSFKFCLSTKARSVDGAAKMVRERRIKLEKERLKQPSSLDIWELRNEPPVNFPPDPDTFVGLGPLDQQS